MSKTFILGFFERFFDIKPREFLRVQTFFLYLTTTSIFYTMGAAVGDTLFLSRFGSARAERLLPWVYIGIGLLTIALTWLYERMEERFPREKFVVGVNLALALSLLIFRWAIRSDQLWLYYALVIWLEACALLALMLFFSFAGDHFTSRDARRLYGYINGGIALGSILGGFTVEALVRRFGDDNLLYVCSGLLAMGALWCVAVAAVSKPVAEEESEEEEEGESRVPLKAVLSDRFLQVVIVVVLVSQAYGWLVDYQFKIIASSHFQEEALAVFFGRFYSALGVSQCVVQFALIGWLLRRMGVVKSLMILPALLLAANGLFCLHPAFLVAAAGNFLRLTFLETLDEPGQELLFLPLASRLRVRAQSFIEGMILPLGISLSGVLLLALAGLLGDARRLSLFGLALGLIWIAAVVILTPRYRETLAASLRRLGLDALDLSSLLDKAEGLKAVSGLLRSASPAQQALALDLWEGRPLAELAEPVRQLARSPDETVAVKALRALSADQSDGHEPAIAPALEDARPAVRAAAISAQFKINPDSAVPRLSRWIEDREPSALAAVLTGCLSHGSALATGIALLRLSGLAASKRISERAVAAKVLAHAAGRRYGGLLRKLLDDPSVEVRREILAALGAAPEAEMVPWLVLQLKEPSLRPWAAEALEKMPLSAVPQFIEILADGALPLEERAFLLRILGRFSGLRGVQVLWEVLASQEDVTLRVAAAETLLFMKSRNKAHDLSRYQDDFYLRRRLDELSLIQRAREEAGGRDPFFGQLLFDQARLEIKAALFAMAIPREGHQIHRVEAALFGESEARRANALEIIELLFPHETASRVTGLIGALTAEPASGGTGLKPGTLEALMRAQPWLRVATRHYLDRQGIAAEGDEKMSGQEVHMYRLLSRVAFLKKVRLFETLSSHYLLSLAKIMQERTFCEGEVLFSQGGKADACYLVCEGAIRLSAGGRPVGRLGPGDIVGEMALIEDLPYSAGAAAEGELRVLRIPAEEFANVLLTHSEITVALLRHVSSRLRESLARSLEIRS